MSVPTSPDALAFEAALRANPDDLAGSLVAQGWKYIKLAAIEDVEVDGVATKRSFWPAAWPVASLEETREQIGDFSLHGVEPVLLLWRPHGLMIHWHIRIVPFLCLEGEHVMWHNAILHVCIPVLEEEREVRIVDSRIGCLVLNAGGMSQQFASEDLTI